MIKFVIALSCLLVVACTEPAESTVASSNGNIPVEKLFNVDGYCVYRFKMGGTTDTSLVVSPGVVK